MKRDRETHTPHEKSRTNLFLSYVKLSHVQHDNHGLACCFPRTCDEGATIPDAGQSGHDQVSKSHAYMYLLNNAPLLQVVQSTVADAL